MKWLILAKNQTTAPAVGHHLFQQEIARQNEVLFWGPGWPGFDSDWDIDTTLRHFGFTPDVVFTYGWRYTEKWVRGLHRVKAFKVLFLGDYYDKYFEPYDFLFHRDGYHLGLVRSLYEYDNAMARHTGKRVLYLPYSVDTDFFKSDTPWDQRPIDVMMVGTENDFYYPGRASVKREIAKLDRSWTRSVYLAEYARKLGQSKIFVEIPSRWNQTSQKSYEAMAAGCLLMTAPTTDLIKQGFATDTHFAIFVNHGNNILPEIRQRLDQQNASAVTAQCGFKKVCDQHDNAIIVKRFTDEIKQRI